VTRLRIGERVAGAALVEIGSTDREPCAEAVKGGQRAQPFEGALGNLAILRQEHDLSAAVASADPAPELVQLSEAEAIGAPDDHRVGARNIEPRLDDIGSQEDIAFAIAEADHGLVDVGSRHLAVRFDECEVRHDTG
jgi:hypothetical protein